MTKEEVMATLDNMKYELSNQVGSKYCRRKYEAIKEAIKALEQDPKPVDYYDCSSAMLKLWMENIVTDSEYYKIMDKLNAKHKEGKI